MLLRERFGEGARVRLPKPFEVKPSQAVESDLRGRAVEYVEHASAQAREHEGHARLHGGVGQLRPELDIAAQPLGQVNVVEEDDGADAVRGGLARNAEAEADERALVCVAHRALERLNDTLDPLEVLRRDEVEERAQSRRRADERVVVAAGRDPPRQEGLEEAARGCRRRVVGAREGEVDGRGAAALSEQLVERLTEKLGRTGLRRGEEDETLRGRLW